MFAIDTSTPKVWALVFLGLALVSLCDASSAEDAPENAKLCTSCHGESGLPADPNIPIIAGQEFYYLYVQLKDYKAGRRENPIMSGIVAGLSKEQMKALAQHFAEKTWPTTGFRAEDVQVSMGEKAAASGQCVQCHLGGYEGSSRVPRLAGQQAVYLERTMQEFKNKTRLNSPAKGSLLAAYPDHDIEAMAHFLADF